MGQYLTYIGIEILKAPTGLKIFLMGNNRRRLGMESSSFNGEPAPLADPMSYILAQEAKNNSPQRKVINWCWGEILVPCPWVV